MLLLLAITRRSFNKGNTRIYRRFIQLQQQRELNIVHGEMGKKYSTRQNCRKLIAVKLYILGVSTVYEIMAEHLCDIMKNSCSYRAASFTFFFVWAAWIWMACRSTECNLISVLTTHLDVYLSFYLPLRRDKGKKFQFNIKRKDSRKNLCSPENVRAFKSL